MNLNNIDFNKYLKSKRFRNILYIIGIAIVVLVVFQAGMFVGFKKARSSYKWAENYERNFGGRFGDMRKGGEREKGLFGKIPAAMKQIPMGMNRGDFQSGHGVIGQVIRVSLPEIAIKDRDNMEKVVILTASTTITKFRDTLKPEDIKADDSVMIIGAPNEKGQIEAKFIRVMSVK